LKLILFRAAYNLPVTLGLERGVFARHGLDPVIDWTAGSRMTIDALVRGERDAGVLAADDVVYANTRESAGLALIMGLNTGILVLMARRGIACAADLRGGRLGVDDPASGFALVAHRILAGLGLGPEEYRTVPSGGHEPRARALSDGRIDAALLTPPFSLALAAAGLPVLARARDHLPRYLGSCLVATRSRAPRDQAALAAFRRAYLESLDWSLAPAHRQAAVDHLAREFALEPELAGATWDALADPADGLLRDARIDLAGLRAVIELRLKAGLMAAPGPEPAAFCDPGFLE